MAKKRTDNTDIIELKEGFTRNQSNVSSAITHARTKMTALELKTFYQVSTLIQMNDTEFKEYEISVSEFSKALNISDSNREQVIKLCKRLLRQVFEIEQERGDYIGYTIFSRMHYKSKEQKIAIKFNQDFSPFLLELKRFTKIQQVKYIKSFESKYAIRFYALLKDYRKMAQRDFSIEALNKMLELPKSYQNYNNFYKKVLKPAIDEINAKSDLYVSEPEIIAKQGKKITEFRLHFYNKSEQMSKDFTTDLIKRFKKWKTFNVFINCYYLTDISDTKPHRIKDIEIDGNYFTLKGGDEYNNSYVIFGTPNRDDFIQKVANGIYYAVNYFYEKEKQEQLPTLAWQDKQDKLREFKNIYESWIKQSIKI